MSKQNEIPSLVKGLFFGELYEEDLFPFPNFSNEQKEMGKEMVDAIDKFAQDNFDSPKFDEHSEIPKEVISGLAELGLCGLAVGEEWGGLGLDYSLYCRVFMQLAGWDGSIATTMGAHQSIGYRALLNEGNPEQKAKWLPRLASGEAIAAFCLTEPSSGSDAFSIKTKATDNGDGTYTLNGQKLWITNGGMAEFYTVFCKTDHVVNGEKKERVSCFIVEKSRAGVSFGEKEKKMGIKASETRAVYFDNVVLPKENILGDLGKGFKIAMNVLNTGRLSLGGGSVGGMKTLIKLASEHAVGRKQFGKSISEFGLIQEKLALMAANCYAAESIVFMTTGKMTQGMKDFSLEGAICKVYCSEALWETVDSALQIAAGSGYMQEYPYERMMRDSRINLIFEGTNEILRCLIALSGIKGPSETLKELGKIADISKALADPLKSLGVLGDFAMKRIGKILSSSKGLTNIHPDLQKEGATLTKLSGDFSIKIENVLIKYGKRIIDNEFAQKRIADMAIHLYVLICVLSRTATALGNESVPEEKKKYLLSLTKIIFRRSRRQFVASYKELDKNTDKWIQSVSQDLCRMGEYGLEVMEF